VAGTLRRYGLIGKSLQHSLSPFIHRRLMEAAGIKGEYKLYELEEGELDRRLFSHRELDHHTYSSFDRLRGGACGRDHQEGVLDLV
jgi:shikimate 5-dehydrogenase